MSCKFGSSETVTVSKFVRQKLMKIMESFPDITFNNRKQQNFSDIRDVRNSNFISIRFYFGFWKKAGNLFGMSFVLFGLKKLTRFGLDTVVIYYLCNTWVVNLQQVLQGYCAVLNELCIPDSDTVVNKLWRHSQQRQQVSNVIAF